MVCKGAQTGELQPEAFNSCPWQQSLIDRLPLTMYATNILIRRICKHINRLTHLEDIIL